MVAPFRQEFDAAPSPQGAAFALRLGHAYNAFMESTALSSTIPWSAPGTIGSGTPNSGEFTTLSATISATISVSGSEPPFTFERTDTHGDGATVGNISFKGKDSGAASQTYGNIIVKATLDNAGAEEGEIEFHVVTGGSVTERLSITGTGVTCHAALAVNGNTTLGDAIGDTTTISGPITATAGQITFPATQNPSADANTLDDYEEGTFVPTLTFATPGNLSVAYTLRTGNYTKVGRQVIVNVVVFTSTFTHSSASGALQITGLPFAAGATSISAIQFQGITKATFTSFAAQIVSAATLCTFVGSGSGVGVGVVNAADTPTGGTVLLAFTLSYIV